MHPRIIYWWGYARRRGEWDGWAGGSAFAAAPGCYQLYASGIRYSDYDRAAFGVRRPLRLLAYKLDLDPNQVSELARILNELKTERAQAEVDERRTVAAFADALAAAAFDEEKVREGAALRVRSTERLQDAVVKALRQIHALLDAEQRAKLAYLIRTGTIML